MLVPLALLPVLTCALVAYAGRPAGPVVGPVRLALVRAGVLVGAGAALLVEALSTVRALTFSVLLTAWLIALGLAAGAAWLRYRRDGALPRPDRTAWRTAWRTTWRTVWRTATTGERVLIVGTAGLVLAELVVALVSPPNNWDSQTYHLPKIEHWVVRRDVELFATRNERQVALAPGAEYLLLHLRLLTGTDLLYNLVQWSAGLGCVLVASRIAGQLGGGRLAQLGTAFLVATAPMVVLESTSTQTDLAVAVWVAAVATLVLDELGRRTPVWAAALVGAGTGLTTLTKATGPLALAPLLLVWLFVQLRRAPVRAVGSGLLVGAFTLALAGPYLLRMADTYGSPLGPEHQRELVSMQRHDPASIIVNALRIGYTALQTPFTPLDTVVADGVIAIAHGLGVDPSGRDITFFDATFPTVAWPPDEDRASFPVQGTLVLVGAAVVLVRRRTDGFARVYAAAFWAAMLIYVATVKWQPWGNRLLLFLLVLGAPLAGLWLGPVRSGTPTPAWRRVGAWVATVALAAGGCAGWLTVGYGWPRRLVGTGSVFTENRTHQRFNRRPQWEGDYLWAAAAVRAAGAHRVGLVQDGDTWEYPWWVLLPGTDIEALQSYVPGYSPAVQPEGVAAILCVTSEATCASHVPPGWRRQSHGTVQVALPSR
jgi:hypothetical protein